MAWEDCLEMSMCFLRVSHHFKLPFAHVTSFLSTANIQLQANLQWNTCLWKWPSKWLQQNCQAASNLVLKQAQTIKIMHFKMLAKKQIVTQRDVHSFLVYVQMLCNKPFYYRHLQTFSCKEKKLFFLKKSCFLNGILRRGCGSVEGITQKCVNSQIPFQQIWTWAILTFQCQTPSAMFHPVLHSS